MAAARRKAYANSAKTVVLRVRLIQAEAWRPLFGASGPGALMSMPRSVPGSAAHDLLVEVIRWTSQEAAAGLVGATVTDAARRVSLRVQGRKDIRNQAAALAVARRALEQLPSARGAETLAVAPGPSPSR